LTFEYAGGKWGGSCCGGASGTTCKSGNTACKLDGGVKLLAYAYNGGTSVTEPPAGSKMTDTLLSSILGWKIKGAFKVDNHLTT